MSEGQWLVLYDADQIKSYVFATGHLREIRGGSMIVERLTGRDAIETHVSTWNGARVIYAAGGAGKVRLASEEDARDFQAWLEARYRRETGIASLTSVRVPYQDDFAKTVRHGERGLRRAKDARLGLASYAPNATGRWTLEGHRSAWQLASGPYSRFCPSCGVGPASRRDPRRGEWVCVPCALKRREIDRLRRDMRGDKDEGLALNGDSFFGASFVKYARQQWPQASWDKAAFPPHLEALGQMSRPENYVGFVYADGDAMGQLLHSLRTEDEYARVSQALTEATRVATFQALGAHLCPRDGIAPFEVTMIGGDDVILIVAAHRALEVALTYSRTFTSGVYERTGHRVTASVGIVLAHASQPILYLERRASELLRLAKRARKGEAMVDYLVVTSPTLNPVERVRARDYEDDHEWLHRTRRPYSLSALERLLTWARKIKFEPPAAGATGNAEDRLFPHNKLIALYQAVFRPKAQSMFDAAHVISRLSAAHRQQICALARDLGFDDAFPWGETTGSRWSWETALPDLVEILDFCQQPE